VENIVFNLDRSHVRSLMTIDCEMKKALVLGKSDNNPKNNNNSDP